MLKKKSVVVVCLTFILNFFTFNVQALENTRSTNKAIGNVDIISTVDVSVESVQAWARSKNATETFVSLAELYKKYATSRGGVNWVLAYVQAAKETGYGKFGGVLDESYNNPCGLKNPSGGDDYDPDAHKKFDNWDQGVQAHLDHLALYAAASGYPKTTYVDTWKDEELKADETYDPRHIGWFGTTSGILGKAKDVISLGGSWAPSETYGVEIFRMYCEATNSEYLPAKSNLESPSEGTTITDGKLTIKGWALHAFGIKEIKVLVDNSQVATLSTGVSRSDVNAVYPGYFNGSNSGFESTIDISSLGEGKKTVEVIVVASDGTTQSHKRNIVVQNSTTVLESVSRLDSPKANETVTSDKLTIRGWAVSSSGIKEVRIYVDGKDLGTVPYGTSRPDVNAAYPGYASGDNAGYDGTVDISSISNGTKKITAKITSNDGTVQTIERNITINVKRLPSDSRLDSPKANETVTSDKLTIRGWAVSSSGIKEVRIYVDGKDLGTVPYGTSRPDVNAAYPGYASGDNAGYDGTVDISSISNGTKKITAKITSNDGTVQTIERNITINVKKLESVSRLDSPTANETVTSDKLTIRGWAVSSSGIKEVRIYVDGKDLGTVPYGTSRPDVNAAYPGYSSGNNAGYDGTVDISSISNGTKKITVKITSKDGTVQTIERNITINVKRLSSNSRLDSPQANATVTSDKLTIRGWAVSASGIKEVRIYVDGKDLGTVPYGTSRPDVNAAYPGYSSGNNAGYDGTVDISSISNGTKKITVKITSNDGTVQTIERNITINVKRLSSNSRLDSPQANATVTSDNLTIRGWALASSGIQEVRIYIDGKDFGIVPYGTSRPDVNAAYPGYSSGDNAGYDGTIDISSLSSGTKKLTVKITAKDGTVQTIERSFTYSKAKLVVIDPGHENSPGDPGACATHNGIQYIESNLNLQIAVKLKAQLEVMGIEVYMTRYEGSGLIDADSTESLKKRVAVANSMNADFFVSIHHNSYTNSSAYGFEVYYSTATPIDPISTSSLLEKVNVSTNVAKNIVNTVSTTLNMYNRGAKDSNLYVCKNTLMPSILIENGFLTNPTEAAKVSTSAHQQKLAEIIAQKISEALQ